MCSQLAQKFNYFISQHIILPAVDTNSSNHLQSIHSQGRFDDKIKIFISLIFFVACIIFNTYGFCGDSVPNENLANKLF